LSLLRPLFSLLASVRRFFARRHARRLRALGLPTARQAIAGLLPGPRPVLPLALRSPGPLEPPESSREFWTVAGGASLIRSPARAPVRLLWLSVLPARLRPLEVLRPARFALDSEWRPSVQRLALSPALGRPLRSETLATLDALARRALPERRSPRLAILRPGCFGLDEAWAPVVLQAALGLARRPIAVPEQPLPRIPRALVDLGVARTAHFGLDEQGRLSSEREVPALALDRPPPVVPERIPPPRTPPAQAPLWRLCLRNFRIDARTGMPANEDLVPPRDPPERPVFLLREFDLELCQPRWMARSWIMFLSALPLELFTLWWLQVHRTQAGAAEALVVEQPEDVWYSLEKHLKEQMMIRRDVIRDENGPKLSEFEMFHDDPQIAAHSGISNLAELMPEKQWIPRASLATDPVLTEERPVFDAYVQWRTLLDGLAER
jgi:hypothetical protein